MLSRDELARLRMLLDTITGEALDRATDYPGGCDCHECGCVFIGGEGHDYCARCEAKRQLFAVLPTSLPTLLRIAEAVAEAPIGLVAVGESRGMLEWWNEGGGQHEGCPTELHGQRVRLVRIDHGRSGEGE